MTAHGHAESVVNYLEKIVMATNSSGLTWIQAICQEQRERERRERQRARINRQRASANFMQHLVTEFCVILLCFKVSVNENFSTLLDFDFFGFLA